jgi:hypothetical protein
MAVSLFRNGLIFGGLANIEKFGRQAKKVACSGSI